MNGSWNLAITNANTTTAANVTATLHLTSGLKPGGGSDSFVASTPIRGALTAPYPLKTAAMPDVGIGPAPTIAADNTLGAYSLTQGRIYIAYTGREDVNISDSTQVMLIYSNDGGKTWISSFGNDGIGRLRRIPRIRTASPKMTVRSSSRRSRSIRRPARSSFRCTIRATTRRVHAPR